MVPHRCANARYVNPKNVPYMTGTTRYGSGIRLTEILVARVSYIHRVPKKPIRSGRKLRPPSRANKWRKILFLVVVVCLFVVVVVVVVVVVGLLFFLVGGVWGRGGCRCRRFCQT